MLVPVTPRASCPFRRWIIPTAAKPETGSPGFHPRAPRGRGQAGVFVDWRAVNQAGGPGLCCKWEVQLGTGQRVALGAVVVMSTTTTELTTVAFSQPSQHSEPRYQVWL